MFLNWMKITSESNCSVLSSKCPKETVWKRKEVRPTPVRKQPSPKKKKKYLWKWKTIGDSLCPNLLTPGPAGALSSDGVQDPQSQTPPWISLPVLSLCLRVFSYFSAKGKHSQGFPESYLKITLKSSWNKDVVFPVGKFWVRFSPFAYDLHILCTIWQEWRSINQSHPALKF